MESTNGYENKLEHKTAVSDIERMKAQLVLLAIAVGLMMVGIMVMSGQILALVE